MLSNLKVKAQPNNLSEFPFLESDTVEDHPSAGYNSTFYCYGGMRHPNRKKCIIMRDTIEVATGDSVTTYMLGSTGSQFDFSCDWADRLTGTFNNPNTEK